MDSYDIEGVADTVVTTGVKPDYDGLTVVDGAKLEVLPGELASNTIISSGGTMIVAGGSAAVTKVENGGSLAVRAGIVSNITAAAGSTVEFQLRCELSGKCYFSGQVISTDAMVLGDDATVIYDLRGLGAVTSPIITDVSAFDCDDWAITVSADQKKGDYVLAGNAAKFDNKIAIYVGSADKTSGSLSADGKKLSVGDYGYSLSVKNGNLVLTVGDPDKVADTEKPKIGKVEAGVSDYSVNFSVEATDNVGISSMIITVNGQKKESADSKLTFENLAVGKYTASVVVVDTSGNESSVKKVTFTIKDVTAPDQVSGLTAGAVDKNYASVLSWTAGTDNSGKVAKYEIMLDNGKIYSSTKANFKASKLSIGSHTFKVRAIDAAKNVGAWSDEFTFTVKDVTAPASVSGKAQVDGYSVSFTLSGKDNSGGIAKYVVTCGDKSVETTDGKAVLSGFGVGKFTATVVGYDAEGNASKPGKITFTVKDATAPDQVSGLTAGTVDKNYASVLSWTAGTDNSGKVAKYEIMLDNGKIYSSTKANFKASKLSIGSHTFKVRAIDAAKNVGAWSDEFTFTVKDVTAPASVSGKAQVDGYSVSFTLSGKDNSGGIAKYVVTCGDKSVETTDGKAVLSGFGVGKFTATVVGYDAEGNASKPGKITFTVKDATAPDQVSGLTAGTVDKNYASVLSWTAGTDNSGKVAKYEIMLDNGKIYSSTKANFKASKLSIGSHTFKVRAIDAAKNVGAWSDEFTFTVKDVTAPAKTSVSVKADGNTVSLSWKTPKDNVGVTGFILKYGEEEIKLDGGATGVVLENIPKGTQSFELFAFDAAGNSSVTSGKFTVKTELAILTPNDGNTDFIAGSEIDGSTWDDAALLKGLLA
ncbi:MAG: AIDA repeat-containing protein [Victivallaceae bacterium]|nr:AIDA repeat-containing protein [Victivallaceae bacterium]